MPESSRPRTAVLAILLGAAVGAAAGVYLGAVRLVEALVWDHGAPRLPGPVWLATIVTCVVGGVLVGLLQLRHGADTPHDLDDALLDIDEVFAGEEERNPPQKLTWLARAALLGVVSLGFGASLGPEAPLLVLATGLGRRVARLLRLAEDQASYISAAGALSGLFGGPLGSVVLPVEGSRDRARAASLLPYGVLASVAGKQGAGSAASRDNVMVCAHYDSVIGAKGANDDGSGTVLTLELARIMRNLPTRANLQFALWGSEEVGLVGARHYVSQLDAAERARVRGVFNNDMVGTSWDPAERYWVLSYDGQPNVVNAQVLAAGERLGYRSQMSDVTQRGSSDHQAFQEQGMPSGNFSWRGVESPALLEPEYHSADDTIEENISMERLTVSMELIGCAAYALARQ